MCVYVRETEKERECERATASMSFGKIKLLAGWEPVQLNPNNFSSDFTNRLISHVRIVMSAARDS